METLKPMKKEQVRDDDDIRIKNTILCAPVFLVTDFESVGSEGVD
jgi:hypothetical protein